MVIKKELPFEHCDTCEHFVLDVDEQVFYTDNVSHRAICVKCKNEWLCKQLKEDIRKETQHDATGT